MNQSCTLACPEPLPAADGEDHRPLARTLPLRRLPAWLGYAGTTLLILAACGIHGALAGRWPGDPFLLFAPAILLATVLFGSSCGLYARRLSRHLLGGLARP